MKNLKILLVDDEEKFISALADRLRLRGFIVTTELDGEDAIEKIETESFDVMVVDLLMPRMGGIELLKRIKCSGIDTPVILLTGHGSSKEGIQGMKLGAYDYLMKPIAFEELLDKLYKASSAN